MLQTNISQLQKSIKYIIAGLIVLMSLHYIPESKLDMKEAIMISAISSIIFAILDMLSPSIKITMETKSL
jgi:hypothetical protein